MSGYIMDLRKIVGHRPLLQVGASVIVEDADGRILLQKRSDNLCWGYAGGSVELDEDFVEVVACPTCGRCSWDSMGLAEEVSAFVEPYSKKAKVAVMGCVVNGPGEAKDADLGIAGGNGSCLIFKKGEPYKKVKAENAKQEFFAELKELLE